MELLTVWRYNKPKTKKFLDAIELKTEKTNGPGRRLVEQTDGCYSEGDSQALPAFIHPHVLGISTISLQ